MGLEYCLGNRLLKFPGEIKTLSSELDLYRVICSGCVEYHKQLHVELINIQGKAYSMYNSESLVQCIFKLLQFRKFHINLIHQRLRERRPRVVEQPPPASKLEMKQWLVVSLGTYWNN